MAVPPKPLKEAKIEKIEIKEHKDTKIEKLEKIEHKEHKDAKIEKLEKNELKEHKDAKHEKLEKFEAKEHKDAKHEKFEHKEFDKGHLPDKNAGKEKDGKELVDGPGPIDRGDPAAGHGLGDAEHFITPNERPDLSTGALSGETDRDKTKPGG